MERQWEEIVGGIPDAPGLSDLDALYPAIEEPVDIPASPSFPPLPPPIVLEPVVEKEMPKKRRKLKLLILTLVIIGSLTGIAHNLGYVEIHLLDEILQFFD
jgi:hypothetical protein